MCLVPSSEAGGGWGRERAGHRCGRPRSSGPCAGRHPRLRLEDSLRGSSVPELPWPVRTRRLSTFAARGQVAQSARKIPRSPTERCPGHAKIAGDLRGGLASFDQADSVSNLAVGDHAGPAPEVLSWTVVHRFARLSRIRGASFRPVHPPRRAAAGRPAGPRDA